jgi:signal transduction histidine kinase
MKGSTIQRLIRNDMLFLACLRLAYALVIVIALYSQFATIPAPQSYALLAIYGFVAYSLAVLIYLLTRVPANGFVPAVSCASDLFFAIVLTALAITAGYSFLAYALFPVITAAIFFGISGAMASAFVQIFAGAILTTVTPGDSWLAYLTWLVQSLYLLLFSAMVGGLRPFGKGQSPSKTPETATQETGVQRERQRIARELHDRVLQSLATITMRAESCRAELLQRPAEMEHELKAIEATTDQAISEIRGLLAEAQTTAHLSKGSLERRLKEELDIFRSRTPLNLKFHCQIDQKNLPYEVERELYFTLREGVLNAMRHSRATELSVSLTQEGRKCCARLIDNGIGFDTSAVEGSSHYGLRGMRERIQKIGGELICESRPGTGTKISINVPL